MVDHYFLCYISLSNGGDRFRPDTSTLLQQVMTTQRQQSRLGAMAAQQEALHRQSELPKSPWSSNTTVEQLLRGEPSKGAPHTSSTFGREHDMEDDHAPPKKSVLQVIAKVKEKARKWRNTLSKKKNNEDSNTTPSWGVSLEDDEEEDPEYLGAPSNNRTSSNNIKKRQVYESEMAPEGYKETARQHPRAIPVMPEKHVLPRNLNLEAKRKWETEQKSVADQNKSETEKKSSNEDQPVNKSMIKNHDAEKPTKTSAEAVTKKPSKTLTEAVTEKPTNTSTEAVTEKPTKTLAEAVTEKLAPAYSTVADATQAIASKIHSLTISTIQTPPPISVNKAERSPGAVGHKGSASLATKQEAPGSAPAALDRIVLDKDRATAAPGEHSSTSEQIWDKGVSVKEFILHKLEPGEDERALSQVITEAISPKRKLGEVSVVEKVKEAVTSLLRNEEPSQNSQRFVYHSAQSSLSQFPASTNSHEVVEEENHGRILQAN